MVRRPPSMDSPCFASALSTDPDADVAERHCVSGVREGLGDEAPDLLVFFVTHHYASALEGLGQRLASESGARVVVGCTGVSVVGGAEEIEHQPGLSLWGGRLGDSAVRAVHMEARPDDDSFTFTPALEVGEPERAGVILLADPFTFPAHTWLPIVAGELPGVTVVGGLASGGQGPHQNLLWLDGSIYEHGAIGIVVEGEVEIRCAVSQGCRPVGEPLVITACSGHLIQGLRGRGAAKVMFQVLQDLPPEDRDLFQRGAHIGLAIDSTKSRFEAEDLLVRNVMGIHPQKEAIVVGDDSLRPGQTVQFMVRDAASASDELSRILEARAGDWSPEEPGAAGALLFTCGGRGAQLFRRRHHDASAVQRHVGPGLPLAGFFANGEIGPVGGRSFLHGFTASLALLRRRRP